MKSILRNGSIGAMCLCLIALFCFESKAQMKSQGPYCGKVFRSNTANQGTLYWVNANGAMCDEDGNHAATDPVRMGQHTQYLQVSGFDFDIPKNASVAGIEVVVIRRADHSNSVRDRSVRLMRASESVGQNKGSNEIWDTEWTAAYYGGDKESWGRKWSPADVNHPEFGVVLDAEFAGDEGQPQVDEVLITVHYYPANVARATAAAGTNSRFTCKSIGSYP